jgi:hypothetical protein
VEKFFSKNIQKTVTQLLKEVSFRNRDIISRRFGLKNGKKETLESIGKEYGITRERVRQLEGFTLKQLSKSVLNNSDVKIYVNWAKDAINSRGGLIKETDLFNLFSGKESDSPINASLLFVLTVDGTITRFPENNEFHSFWATNKEKVVLLKELVNNLIKALENQARVMSLSELQVFSNKNSIEDIELCLSLSKTINKNIFGQVGLISWPEIRPRGVRDKAYLVLKNSNSPKHFKEIADLINKVGFSFKKANVQTVHNELIKDPRFVLVGRGIYALSEWGYSKGTVKDVLIEILKKAQKPIPRTELVAKVKDIRFVKENTILLNLQDSKTFTKKEDGTYVLKKV